MAAQVEKVAWEDWLSDLPGDSSESLHPEPSAKLMPLILHLPVVLNAFLVSLIPLEALTHCL